MKNLDIFQLLSVVNKGENDEVRLEARCLNKLHQKLLKHNIRSDFSRDTLERIEYDFPNYIEVKKTELVFRNVSSFRNIVYHDRNKIDNNVTRIIEEQWQLILKEF